MRCSRILEYVGSGRESAVREGQREGGWEKDKNEEQREPREPRERERETETRTKGRGGE